MPAFFAFLLRKFEVVLIDFYLNRSLESEGTVTITYVYITPWQKDPKQLGLNERRSATVWEATGWEAINFGPEGGITIVIVNMTKMDAMVTRMAVVRRNSSFECAFAQDCCTHKG